MLDVGCWMVKIRFTGLTLSEYMLYCLDDDW
jgi:hypothetical protein